MSARLYFSRNPNPRLAVATARYIGAAVDFEWAAPFEPDQQDRFRKLNPSLCVPILEDADGTLWETDAIACRLSLDTGSEFWRTGTAAPEMIRWLSWGMWNFMRACDKVHFERGTKRRYHFGAPNEHTITEGLAEFDSSGAILDAHLSKRDWLMADGISYADFRMATFLPFNDVARLPLEKFANIQAWYDRLCDVPAWRDPFEGMVVPELPPVRGTN